MRPECFSAPRSHLLCKVKRPKIEVYFFPSSSTDMRNEWDYTSTTACVFMACAWTAWFWVDNKRVVQLDARNELCKSVRKEEECMQWTFLQRDRKESNFSFAGRFHFILVLEIWILGILVSRNCKRFLLKTVFRYVPSQGIREIASSNLGGNKGYRGWVL